MTPTVCVIDDDRSVQRALRRLLQSAGYQVLLCSSAADFLELTDVPHPICLVVDVRMPGMTGLDLQAALSRQQRVLPIIMISGHADEGMILRATAAGAIAFLSKPFEEQALLDALAAALPGVRQPAPRRALSRE
jgi:FixJ family two-component response regulator